MPRTEFKTIDEYISLCSVDIAEILEKIRAVIKEAAPNATEKISWSMPTFYYNGNLVHFMAHKNHIGFYPGSSGIENFAGRFKNDGYKYSKGAVQFPLDKPIDYELISEIVRFRVEENKSAKAVKP